MFNFAFACSCAINTNIQLSEYLNSEVIYTGKAIKVSENEKIRIIEFEIDKVYKGVLKGTTKIVLKTNAGGASGNCGLDVNKDERWMIWGYYHDDELYSDFCTRSAKLEKAESQLRFIESLKNTSENKWLVNNVPLGQGKIINGKPEGNWEFYNQGRLNKTGKYLNGKEVGEWQFFLSNRGASTTFYDNGEPQWVKNYYLNGKLSNFYRSHDLIDGKVEDKEVSYYQNGKMKFRKTSLDGRWNTEEAWYANGQKVYENQNEMSDKKAFYHIFDKNGKLLTGSFDIKYNQQLMDYGITLLDK